MAIAETSELWGPKEDVLYHDRWTLNCAASVSYSDIFTWAAACKMHQTKRVIYEPEKRTEWFVVATNKLNMLIIQCVASWTSLSIELNGLPSCTRWDIQTKHIRPSKISKFNAISNSYNSKPPLFICKTFRFPRQYLIRIWHYIILVITFHVDIPTNSALIYRTMMRKQIAKYRKHFPTSKVREIFKRDTREWFTSLHLPINHPLNQPKTDSWGKFRDL